MVPLPKPPHIIYFTPLTQEPSLSLFPPHTPHLNLALPTNYTQNSTPSHHCHPTVQSTNISLLNITVPCSPASLPSMLHPAGRWHWSTSHPTPQHGRRGSSFGCRVFWFSAFLIPHWPSVFPSPGHCSCFSLCLRHRPRSSGHSSLTYSLTSGLSSSESP